MAQQTINIGTAANDGSGDPLRTAYGKINDNFTELYNLVAALGSSLQLSDFTRVNVGEVCNGTTGQVITFSAPMPTADYAVYVYSENGDVFQQYSSGNPVQDVNGFTIDSLSSGTFTYIALIEV